MKSYIYLLQYNNYFNRRVLKAGTRLAAYSDYVVANVATANFDMADGINTTVIINTDKFGDYIVVIDSDTEPTSTSEITSRWFVLEQRKVRGKQYQLTLRRDVIAENIDAVITAPCFVEKGTIDNESNPLIYNQEGLSFNQIKTSELPLYDKTKCPWLVAYLSKKTLGGTSTGTTGTINYDPADSGAIQLSVPLESWEFYGYNADNPMKVCDSFTFRWDTIGFVSNTIYFNNSMNKYGITNYKAFSYTGDEGGKTNMYNLLSGNYWNGAETNKVEVTEKLYAKCKETDFDTLNSAVMSDYGYVDQATYTRLKGYEGKLIRDSAGKYFSILVNEITVSSTEEFVTSGKSTYTTMTGIYNAAFSKSSVPNDYALRYKADNYKKVTVTIKLESAFNFTYNMTATTSTSSDPLYDIICVPYGEITMKLTDSSGTVHTITTSETLGMKFMEGITTQLGASDGSTSGGRVLDLQLVPYCPIPSDIIDEKVIQVNESARIIPCTQNNVYKYGAIVAPQGTFSTAIDENITINRPTHTSTYMQTVTKSGLGRVISGTTATISITTGSMYDITAATVQKIYLSGTSGVSVSSSTVTTTSTSVSVTVKLSSTFTGVINVLANVTGSWDEIEYDSSLVEDVKASNECDMYRLCSPNYNGVFEFSVAKNGNSVNGFHADCTYKPYNPYIYVHPNFSGLYSQNFEDARGLICGGEFSLGILTDA